MLTGHLTIECNSCLEDITIDLIDFSKEDFNFKSNKKPLLTFRNICDKAAEQGFRIGRFCRCPACYNRLPAHCNTCEHYEGNKSMGASICRLDGEFTTPDDYCPNHKQR